MSKIDKLLEDANLNDAQKSALLYFLIGWFRVGEGKDEFAKAFKYAIQYTLEDGIKDEL